MGANMRIILLGPPGVGKGTQAELLCQHFDIPQISTGDMLRDLAASHSSLGEKIHHLIASGKLVDDHIVLKLVEERIKQKDCVHGFLFDGFPRTIAQADALKHDRVKIDYVIELYLDDEDIIDHIAGRLIHPASGRVYHNAYHPPKIPDKDDETGEPLIHRIDDNRETILQRLHIYREHTELLIHYYQNWMKSGDTFSPKYHAVSGEGSIKQVFERILENLKN